MATRRIEVRVGFVLRGKRRAKKDWEAEKGKTRRPKKKSRFARWA